MRLLIVGSLDGYMNEAGRIAHQRGAKVSHTESIDGAMTALRAAAGIDLVMIDVRLDVAHMVEALKAERFCLPVVACGIGTDAAAAVRAIRAGAKEYIPLPPDAKLIAAVLEAVAEESHAIVTQDPVMAQVMRLADQVAPSEASVLITGESGTGKELMARYIHRKSRRADAPFVSVNCAAIPEHLLESELFGHEKGSFTGAVARRVGKFEEANGGTLLLDEITEMQFRLQAKLLRAIQEREIDRVGGSQPVKVDIRLIATTNRDVEQSVRAGEFREDLFFRLNVFTVRLPALRERPLDVPLVADHFIKKYAEINGMPHRPLSPEAMAKLQSHYWRGNIRELENTMHRAVLLAHGPVVGPEAIMLTGSASNAPEGFRSNAPAAASPVAAAYGSHAYGAPQAPAPSTPQYPTSPHPASHHPAPPSLPGGYGRIAVPPPVPVALPPQQGSGTAGLVGRTVAEVERELIIDTLHRYLGNRTHAANILGISIRTLRNKLRQYSDEGHAVPPPGESDRAAV